MTKEQIAGLRELLERATPGEWTLKETQATNKYFGQSLVCAGSLPPGHNIVEILVGSDPRFVEFYEQRRTDARLIVALKNAAPELLTLAEREAENGKEARSCRICKEMQKRDMVLRPAQEGKEDE